MLLLWAFLSTTVDSKPPSPTPLGPSGKINLNLSRVKGGPLDLVEQFAWYKSIAHCFPLPPLTLQIKINFSLVVAGDSVRISVICRKICDLC